jgi:hypothetical protein
MIYFKSQTVENKPKYKTNKQTKIQNKQTNKNTKQTNKQKQLHTNKRKIYKKYTKEQAKQPPLSTISHSHNKIFSILLDLDLQELSTK